ncbi:MAG TPA: response regulator, partial [bacterium]|nr:response regulator [bacterium]
MNDPAQKSSDSSQRILVIDDEAIICLSCERILASDGHKVDFRNDAREGLETAIKGNYDIILLDLMMPDLGGLELLDLLRQAGVTSEVIIITGHAAVQTAVEA